MTDPDLDAQVAATHDDWVIPPTEPENPFPYPEFPLDALPEWVAEHVTATTGVMQTPVDFAGALSLVALSAVCGGRIEVQVNPQWKESVCLFVVIVSDPGTRKSAVFNRMLAPLKDWEKKIRAKSSKSQVDKRVEAEIARDAADKALKAAKEDSSDPKLEKEAKTKEAKAVAAQAALETVPRLVVSDVTPEQLAVLLGDNEGRLVLASDEGGLFGTLAGRYSTKPNIDVILQAWSGSPVTVDRRSMEGPIEIERPALTIGLAVQPKVIGEVVKNQEFSGRGLVDRFLVVEPKSTLGSRDHRASEAIAAAPETEKAREVYVKTMLDLFAKVDKKALVIPFDEKAAEMFLAWKEDLEPRLAEGEDLAPVAGLASKMHSNAVRIATMLHVGDHTKKWPPGPVGEDAMRRALRLVDYFILYTLRMQAELTASPTTADATELLRWLREKHTGPIVTKQQIQASSQRFKDASAANDVIAQLVALGWLQRPKVVDGERKRGRPRSEWVLHPSIVS